jgi:uncharacterized protein YbjT (DUF2867 family)
MPKFASGAGTTRHACDALLAGATGLVGRELAASWTGPGILTLLVRRPMPAAANQVVQVVNFANLPALPPAQVAYCCLGTTIAVAGSAAAFRAVDLDAVLAFARAAQNCGVRRLAVVSALGADPASRALYNRTKGEMEAALRGLGFDSLVIARPSLLAGDRAALGQPRRGGERLALALTAPLAGLIPKAWRPIEAARVARAMRRALAEATPGVRVLESAGLQALGA